MKSLFLAWQAPENSSHSRNWFPIGRLDRESRDAGSSSYRFRYIQGALTAQKEAGFHPLVSFPELKQDYQSEKLFPLFHNRVISPKRDDYPEYIDWLGLKPEEADPISILSVSGGTRVTDNLQTFPKVNMKNDGSFQLRFFAHGARHLTETSQQRAKSLVAGDPLR